MMSPETKTALWMAPLLAVPVAAWVTSLLSTHPVLAWMCWPCGVVDGAIIWARVAGG